MWLAGLVFAESAAERARFTPRSRVFEAWPGGCDRRRSPRPRPRSRARLFGPGDRGGGRSRDVVAGLRSVRAGPGPQLTPRARSIPRLTGARLVEGSASGLDGRVFARRAPRGPSGRRGLDPLGLGMRRARRRSGRPAHRPALARQSGRLEPKRAQISCRPSAARRGTSDLGDLLARLDRLSYLAIASSLCVQLTPAQCSSDPKAAAVNPAIRLLARRASGVITTVTMPLERRYR